MVRQLDQPRRQISKIAREAQTGIVQQGYLAEQFFGKVDTVRVRFGPSTSGLPAVKADIIWPLELPSPYPVDTPVSLSVVRGRLTVLSIAGPLPLVGAYYMGTATTQSLTSSLTYSTVTFANSQMVYDTDGFFDDTNDILIAPRAGYYDLFCYVEFDTNASGSRRVSLDLNGTHHWQWYGSISAGQPVGVPITVPSYSIASGDTLGVSAAQNSGGNLNIVAKEISMVLRH